MIIQASKVEVSRDEWDCYSFTPDAIIADVNTGITEILMTTHHPVTAQKRVYEFLESYKKYGFRDSEGDMAPLMLSMHITNQTSIVGRLIYD